LLPTGASQKLLDASVDIAAKLEAIADALTNRRCSAA